MQRSNHLVFTVNTSSWPLHDPVAYIYQSFIAEAQVLASLSLLSEGTSDEQCLPTLRFHKFQWFNRIGRFSHCVSTHDQ